jgi:hypothetical protein
MKACGAVLFLILVNCAVEEITVASPVISTQEEYQKLAPGTTYWRDGRLQMKPASVPGSTAQSPIHVRRHEEYDQLPDDTWISDDAGDVMQKGHPVRDVTSKEDYDSVPIGASYRWKGRLYIKGESPWQEAPTPSATPAPTPSALVWDWSHPEEIVFVAILLIISGSAWLLFSGRKAKPQPDQDQKQPAQVYYDQAQYQLAMRVWERDRLLFEEEETKRLAAVEEEIRGGPIGTIGCLGVIGLFISAMVSSASQASRWTPVCLGFFAWIAVAWTEQTFRRWRRADRLVRRDFTEPQPVYRQQAQTESSRRSEEWKEVHPQEDEPTMVTSMRQAYDILGLPPGRISIKAARSAYRVRMMEYHPDRVAHLGPELRKLAARKATEINAAMKYIEEHVQ